MIKIEGCSDVEVLEKVEGVMENYYGGLYGLKQENYE